ncbi:UDP-2,3-diacylglucosamine diphosphatase [Variovorax sp. J22G21]|uniref:UDP-2,3-diacylglucosamine diphosphatase n=1 Tax=Variovorax fucosicus TaxID=3053517 RepID=UPI002575EB3D|nr:MULTISPECIES: UDP-2,3-diacylglucosamine diphosphatase [unclassified Variovorax]MDM0042050.1 UDP-2,3-diacylglucosamine diphosphatase [Variovorax sp. J22R193]MDM0059820.1 UDP-2,3-diacylglucosamine diphosphatase [Variovorax sp. J22G21]
MTPFAELAAPAGWRTVDLLSDLHLQAGEPATFEAWRGYMETTPADAIFILGDLFEVWIGDDAAALPGFEAQCAEVLRSTAQRRPVFFMHGNRDFLLGPTFAAACGISLLADPTVLELHGERWLLSHGDELCLEDHEYLQFRAQVRSPDWQQAFLARPLEERRALARSMRAHSEDRKRSPDMVWADVDPDAAREWLHRADARTLIHGHTHRPAEHDLGDGLRRIVLSDWDMAAHPPRAQLLCLSVAGAQRVDLR